MQSRIRSAPRPSHAEGFRRARDGGDLIRHYWEGPVACKDPVYGRWGGPPGQGSVLRRSSGPGAVQPAEDLANAPRGRVKLGDVVRSPLPALGIKGSPRPLRPGEKRDAPADAE